MSNVVRFGRASAPVTRPVDFAAIREVMRRRQVAADIARLLAERSGPGMTFAIVEGHEGHRVDVTTGPRTTVLTASYPADRLDDFAGVVRAGVDGWRRTHQRRAAFAVVV